MRIKQIGISGFKSFCDYTQICFNQPVTTVVGPNGCGKSNIVDAVRWALGEQSARNLRGKAMEDVIFNGSDNRGPMSMAEVTVTFDNSDGLSHDSYLDFPEIAVTRRLYRDGTSEYLINNVPCRLKDVTDLFLGTGGGARAYSIIEQGRIGLIVSARPEDRRGMIEEAAGITKYKLHRRAAERRMELTRQELLRQKDVLAEKERTISNLKRQAQKAERYKKYRDEQVDLELHVASHEYLRLRAEAVATDQALKETEALHADRRNAFTALETEVAAMRLEEAEARSGLEKATATGYEIGNDITVIENEIRNLHEAVLRHRSEAEQIAEQKTEAGRKLEAMRGEKALLGEQQVRVEQAREKTLARIGTLSASLETARFRLESVGAEYDEKVDRISRLRAHKAAAETAVKNLAHRIEETRGRLETVTEEKGSIDGQFKALERQAEELKEKASIAQAGLDTARSAAEAEGRSFARIALEVEQCDAERRRLRDDLQAKAAQKSSLEEVMNALDGHDDAVRKAVSVIEEGDAGLFGGLLIDTIECPERFEKALAAALADRLQAFLVNDRNAGIGLLGMLKDRDVGRVSVVAKERLRALPREPIAVQGPAVIGPLADLLTTGPAAADLVADLLDAVYVVPDLAEAEKLWNAHEGRAAFVTLDGQMLEASGVMRGGSASSVGAGLLEKKRRIRELAVQVEEQTRQSEAAEARFAALKAELVASREAGEQARLEAQSQELKLAAMRKDASRATEDLAGLEQRFESLRQEIAHQEEMLEQAENDRRQAAAEAAELEAEMARLELLVAEQRAEIEKLREAQDKVVAEIADVRVEEASLSQQQIGNADRQRQLGESLEATGRALERADQLRAQALQEIERATAEASGARERLSRRLEDAAEAERLVGGCRTRLDERQALLTDAEIRAKALRASVDEAGEILTALKMQAQEAGLSIAHLRQSVWDRNACDLLRVLGDYHLRALPGDDVRIRIDELRGLIDRMGAINPQAIEEFRQETEIYEQGCAHKEDLEQALENLERAIAIMDKESKQRFQETFEDVNKRFQQVFPQLFKGGNAHLELTDPGDMLHTGVEIVVRPPGKHLRNIELLSGGEKALTAVALLFAIFLHRPSPFCVLDEVDAPFDEPNVDRFVTMIRQLTERSQFILITHNKLTMEKSDILYGVTMEEPGVSKMVSVRLNALPKSIAVNG